MPPSPDTLAIVHVLRAPLGGLFRHVLDVAEGQSARGHRVGIVADSTTGGDMGTMLLDRIRPMLALGVTRFPMPRQIGFGDAVSIRRVAAVLRAQPLDVVHGHGSKGGAYGRLAAPRSAITVYTPHGGSLHFRRTSPAGLIYDTIEWALARRTDLFLFESEYARTMFRNRIDPGLALIRVARNGLTTRDFDPVTVRPDATDLLFIGELRTIKGVDLLLDALADLREAGLPLTATIVGDGPDREALKSQAAQLGLGGAVRFLAPMPAREAFGLGRIAVVPSRAESLPYIVLELAAAGLPMIVTNVGGIAEIFGPQADRLIASGDRAALGRAVASAVNDPKTMMTAASVLRERVRREFSAERMVHDGLAAYREAIAIRNSSSVA